MSDLPEACARLLAAATGVPVDQLPADAMDRLALVQAAQLIASVGKKPVRFQPLAPADSAALEQLLPAIFERKHVQPWTVGGLTTRLPRSGNEAALAAALEMVPGNLGAFLTRCAGPKVGGARAIAGYRIEYVGRHGNQNEWRVRLTGSKSP